MRAALYLGIGLAGCLPSPAAAQTVVDSSSAALLMREFLGPRVGKDIGSATLAVVQDGRVVYLGSLGDARPGEHRAADPDTTVYQIGSVSKLMTAIAVLQLVERGEVTLDADIRRYLPDLPLRGLGGPVTLGQLLTHTSGIEDRMLGRNGSRNQPVPRLADYFRRHPPRRVVQGGVEVNYSGNGIALAAAVVEAVSGEPFDTYVARHIFQPLGMTSSSFHQPLPAELKARRASMPDLPPLIPYPVGGMASTAADMARFMAAMLGDGSLNGQRVLQPATLELMQEQHFAAAPGVPGMAYGFFRTRLNGQETLLHSGDYQHLSMLMLVPGMKLGLFLVVNPIREIEDPLVSAFPAEVARRFLPVGGTGLSASAAAPLDRAAARRLAGYYRDDAIPHATVERFFVGLLFGESEAAVSYDQEAGRLYFHPPETRDSLELVPAGEGRYRVSASRGADPLGPVEAYFVFQQAPGRSARLAASLGPLGEYSFRRIPALLAQRPQLLYFLGSLAVFGCWLIYLVWQLMARRIRRRPVLPREERTPALIASVTALGAVGGFVGFSLLGLLIPSVAMMTGIPAAFYALPLGCTLACVAALGLPYALLRAWRQHLFGLGGRLLLTAVACAGVLFIPFCAYWNLLGLYL